MQRSSFLMWLGLLSTLLGFILLVCLNNIVDYIMYKQLILAPDSSMFHRWAKQSFHFPINFYLFNCTNIHQLTEKDFVPQFEELGPFSFNEYHEKINITWNDNNTVSFKQIRRWYYDEEKSNRSLDTEFFTLNIPPVTSGFMTRHWSSFSAFPISLALSLLSKSVWIKVSAKEFIQEGYTDPILAVTRKLPAIDGMRIPEKMGILHEKNGTTKLDRIYNIDTGVNDIKNFGVIRRWDYSNQSASYDGACGEIKGSGAEFFHPGLKRDRVEMFNVDICRSIYLDYAHDINVKGIHGYRYYLSDHSYDNGSIYPDSICNCGGECVPRGVLNVSRCQNGIPTFASNPHFFGADPIYINQIKGMNPDPQKHNFYLSMEPTTGIVLEAAFRIQYSMHLRPNPKIRMMANVPNVMFPMLWFEQFYTISDEFVILLRILLLLPTLGLYLSVALMLLGVFMTALSTLPSILRILSCVAVPIIIRGRKISGEKVLQAKASVNRRLSIRDDKSNIKEENPLLRETMIT